MDDPDEVASSLTVLLFAAVGITAMMLMITQAEPADVGCLTQEQARKRWPTEHLYWHTSARCWDNQRKGVRRESTRSPSEYEKKPHQRWAGGVKTVRWQDYNEIDAMADREQFFRRDSVALWPPFFDTWNYVWNRLWRP